MKITRKSIVPYFFVFVFHTMASHLLEGQALINNNVTFIQGDSIYLVSADRDTIEIDRKPFSIRYFGKRYNPEQKQFYAAQIAVLDNRKDIGVLTVGMSTENIAYFEPGSGMAQNENCNDYIMAVNESGHHYLIYENESHRRVDLISKKANILELQWNVSGVNFRQTKDLSFSEMKKSTLYFVIFLDRNSDDIFDEGELKVVTVNFKS
ncbi:MAG: hypothetical protein RLZZ382_2143 [Bacteroidota bacterium]